MRIQKLVTPLLLAGVVLAAAAHSQEPPPFPGGAEAQAPNEQQPATEAITNDPEAASASIDYFHEQLAPHGQWVAHEGAGEVWVPKVAPGWRPYTNGHWVSTDQGLAWMADEPWGWATFHYGRWGYDQETGWAWTPGNVWAPAWVAWRHGDGYLGWAPLPPTVGFSADARLSLATESITPGFYTFVAERNVLAPRVDTVILPSTRNELIVRKAADITRYTMSDHRVLNSSIDAHRLEHFIGRPVTPIRVAELAKEGTRGGRGAFYQPPVVTHAAGSTHSEFGRSRSAQPSAQPVTHPGGRYTVGPNSPAPSRTPREPYAAPTPRPYSSPSRVHSAPTPAPQNHPAPTKAQSQAKPQPKKPGSEDKSKEKPPN
jgi:hypothetical protein